MYMYIQSEKDRLLLLCAVGGLFGLHRFYLKRWKTGLLWAFTGGLGFVGWLVDLFVIAFGRFKDADGDYVE